MQFFKFFLKFCLIYIPAFLFWVWGFFPAVKEMYDERKAEKQAIYYQNDGNTKSSITIHK